MESMDKSSDKQTRTRANHIEIMPKVSQETRGIAALAAAKKRRQQRSEEHTSELQSRPHISYAVYCLKKKNVLTPVTLHSRMPSPVFFT